MNNNLLDPNFWSIKQVFDYQYNIPVYQRPYSWQADQIDSLYDDISDSYKEYLGMDEANKYLSGLYVGNIILHSKSIGLFDIIDGQQRITTFALLILALYAKSYELNADLSDRIVQKLQAALWKLDGADMPLQDKRAITLGSIDRDFFIKIMDLAYSSPKDLKRYIVQFEPTNEAEDNIKTNFIRIYDYLNEDYKESKNLLLFANFVLTKIYLIAINTNGSEVKAFTIFESINSKGKKLEEIDLIKTYVFSKLKEKDYQTYLSKWGDLIIKTNDDLYGYLKTYLRAYIKYYTQNISYNNFKTLDGELCSFFKKANIGDAYKSLIDDMIEKVDFYKALFDVDKCYKILKDNKFRFYFYLYIKIKYEHPRPLFFRILAEYNNGQNNLSKEDAIAIFIETIKAMAAFLTISQKDSKDIIEVFRTIFDDIRTNKKIDKDLVLYRLNAKLQTSGLRAIDISSSLSKLDLFDRNKILGAAIVSLYESKIEDSKLKLSWDEAYSKFSTFGTSYTLDHIMNQTPEISDQNLKYYKLGNNLKLKDGHDFPTEIIHDGMDYQTFKSLILHVAGNLRLKGRDGNSSRGNSSEEDFCTYKSLCERTEIIVKFIMDNFLTLEKLPDDYVLASSARSGKSRITGNFDFSIDDLDLKGVKAQSLTVFDTTYPLTYNKDILKYLIIYLFKEYEQKLLDMSQTGWGPHKRVILTWDKSLLISPYEIVKDKVYVETNLSSNDIICYAKAILNELNFPADLVTIYIPE